ncbi:MAG: type IX secretion system membrane protein PorP/SprF [Puia sp.]|nr:type IX secretion system membrane protein PorP/SprF [Puia sp.]
MKSIWSIPVFVLFSLVSRAQEINFSRVQDMTVWYNQSLKTDKQDNVILNYRNVQFGGAIAYNSVSAMGNIPLLSKTAKDQPNSGYFSLSVGAASDKSNQGILSNTLGLLGISYAVPISSNETYVAVGFQGSYYQSQLNVNGNSVYFGDQFNSYGPVEGSPSADQLAAGWHYGHFNINAGLSIFNNSKTDKWYLGASVAQLNEPYTDRIKTDATKLRPGLGIQGGYRFLTQTEDEIAFYAALNWQGGAYKHFFNATYVYNLPAIPGGAVGFGLGYRYDDALVPDVELRYQKVIIALSYDVNISTISAAGINRNGVELAFRTDF